MDVVAASGCQGYEESIRQLQACFNVWCNQSVFFTTNASQEKMVGSTAVARQLLREIADRLDADRVPYAAGLQL